MELHYLIITLTHTTVKPSWSPTPHYRKGGPKLKECIQVAELGVKPSSCGSKLHPSLLCAVLCGTELNHSTSCPWQGGAFKLYISH